MTSHGGINQLREALNEALYGIIRLETGLSLRCAPITDPDQLKELLRAKNNILEALCLAPARPECAEALRNKDAIEDSIVTVADETRDSPLQQPATSPAAGPGFARATVQVITPGGTW